MPRFLSSAYAAFSPAPPGDLTSAAAPAAGIDFMKLRRISPRLRTKSSRSFSAILAACSSTARDAPMSRSANIASPRAKGVGPLAAISSRSGVDCSSRYWRTAAGLVPRTSPSVWILSIA